MTQIMQFHRFVIFTAVLLFSFTYTNKAYPQEIENFDGDVSFLKGQKTINVEFVYDGMKVGEFTEELYLKQKRSEYKKQEDFDKFAAKWVSDRKDKYEPKFIEQFNLGAKKIGLTAVKDHEDSQYTLIVKTVRTEPGFFKGSGGYNRDTFLDLQFIITKTSDKDQIKATFEINRIVGVGDNNTEMKDTQLKIKNAYGSAGYKVGRFIVKNCK